MPRFPKGSQEAKIYMASIRNKRQTKKGEGCSCEGGDLISGLKKLDKWNMKTGKKVDKYVEVVAKGRNDYPPKVRTILKKYGDQIVVSAELRRAPVQSMLVKAMDAFTFGKFSENMGDTPYDSLFHLQIVFTLSGGKKVMVEKNEVINMAVNAKVKPKSEVLAVSPMKEGLTFIGMMDATKERMGDKFFTYSARDNNCQDFIMAILQANGIGNTPAFEFVKQDTKTLFKGLSGLSKVANVLTSAGAKVNEITQGAGMGSSKIAPTEEELKLKEKRLKELKEKKRKIVSKVKTAVSNIGETITKSIDDFDESMMNMMEGKGVDTNYVVQSVVFPESKFDVKSARKWLREHKYKSPKVEKTENTLRFRQLPPKSVEKKGFTEFRNKMLGDSGIFLVIAYKKIVGEGGRSSKITPAVPLAETSLPPPVITAEPANEIIGRVGEVVEEPTARRLNNNQSDRRRTISNPIGQAAIPTITALPIVFKNETTEMKKVKDLMKKKNKEIEKTRKKINEYQDTLNTFFSSLESGFRNEVASELLDREWERLQNLQEEYQTLLADYVELGEAHNFQTTITATSAQKEGSGIKRKFVKGSQEAKIFMENLRNKRKKK